MLEMRPLRSVEDQQPAIIPVTVSKGGLEKGVRRLMLFPQCGHILSYYSRALT